MSATAKSPTEEQILRIQAELKKKGIDISKANATIIYALQKLAETFERFMFDDLKFSENERDLTYKSELSLTEFYKRKLDIVKQIIDVAMLLRVSHPHLKYLHTEVPKAFREALDEIGNEGKKPAVYQLFNKILAYQYEIISALSSGRSTSLLEIVDTEFMDTAKMYREALRNLSAEHWLAYVVLQVIAKHSGGNFMSVKDIALKLGVSETAVRMAVNTLFEKCKEILVVDQRGAERYIQFPTIYAKYELIKM